jgi:hypothetical protein
MEVNWDDKQTQALYEDMISTLIKRIHPSAQRVDGSGGDGGRDLHVHNAENTIIYELKSFTGRLSHGGRKQQISQSLRKAARHRPDAWRLVVPIDPTPSEEEWFCKLTAEYPFPCQWCGLTWLNAEISQRPEIPRYFLEGHERRVLQMLKELKAEEAATADSQVVLGRVKAMQNRLNQTDPMFHYEFSTWANDKGQVDGSIMTVRTNDGRIDVVPRYATALEDRPITFHAQLRTEGGGDGAISMLEESINYGEPVTITPDVLERVSVDAPGGLSTELRNATIQMEPLQEALESPMLLHATIVDSDGTNVLGKHEFTIRMRRSGRKGAILFGSDVTGLIDIEVKFRLDDLTLNITLDYRYEEVLPNLGRKATEWLEMFRPPNLVSIDVGSPLRRVGQSKIVTPAISAGISELFRAFETVQERAGVPFPVPADLSREEFEIFLFANRWLSDDKVKFTWEKMRFTCDGVDEILEHLPLSGSVGLLLAEQRVIEFRGRELPLGYRARKIQAQLSNAEEMQQAIRGGEAVVPIELRPGDSNVGWEWILPRNEEPGPENIKG